MSVQKQEVTMVKSNIDNNEYLVLNLPDKQQAADLLGRLNKDILKFIGLLYREYPNREDIQFFKKNYTDGNLTEASENGGSSTSYTINKSEIFVCLRNGDGSFVDYNTLLYVVLIHEAGSHQSCSGIGHSECRQTADGNTISFWQQLEFMKKKAIEYGIYQEQDYSKKPLPYCGIILNSGG